MKYADHDDSRKQIAADTTLGHFLSSSEGQCDLQKAAVIFNETILLLLNGLGKKL